VQGTEKGELIRLSKKNVRSGSQEDEDATTERGRGGDGKSMRRGAEDEQRGGKTGFFFGKRVALRRLLKS